MDNTKRKTNAELYQSHKKSQSKNNKKDGTSNRLSNRDLYFLKKDELFAESVPSRLESLTKQGSDAYNTYKSRFFDENGEFINSYRGDTEAAYNDYSTFKSNYDTESKAILEHLDRYGDNYDAKTVTEIRDYLTSSSEAYEGMLNAYKEDNEYFSKFADENEYNEGLESAKVYEQQKVADLDALSKEVKELEAKKNEYIKLKGERDNQYATFLSGYLRSRQYTKEEAEAKALAHVKGMDEQLAQYGDIGKEYNDKLAYYNTATRIQRADELASVADDEDFEKYSAYNSTAKKNAIGKTYYGDDKYEYINNAIPGVRDELNRDLRTMNRDNPYADSETYYEEKGYDFLEEKEIQTYNYYYEKEGKKKAEEYLDSLQDTLNYRKAESRYGSLKDNTFLEVLFGVEAGLDQFKNGVQNLFNGDDYIPVSSTQVLSGMVRKDLRDDGFKIFGSSLGQIAYDAVTTTSNMMPSILLSYATAGIGGPAAGVASKMVGAASMGASASGNAYQEMLNLGYGKGQARSYAALVGASEAGLEYILGGISSLGGKMSGNVVAKAVSGVDNAFARFAIKYGGSMLSEGIEEGLQEILTPYFENLVFYADKNVDWQQVAYSGLLGAISAGVLEGGSIASGEVNTYRAGKQIKEAGQTSNLVKLGKSFSAVTVAAKIANKVNENTGAYTIGRLLHEVGADGLSEANMADITKSLERKGIAPEHAQTIAKWLNKSVEGGYFSKSQIEALDTNEDIAKTFKDVIINQNSTVNQRVQSYNDILQNVANEIAAQEKTANNKEVAKDKVAKTDISPSNSEAFAMLSNEEVKRRLAQDPEFAIEYAKWTSSRAKEGSNSSSDVKQPLSNRFDVSNNGKTTNAATGESINVSSIHSISNGKMKLKLDNGEVVDVDEVEFASDDEGLLYSAVLDMGLSVGAANSVVLNYNPASGLSVSDYVHGIREAYEYGTIGVPLKSVSKFHFASKLSEKQITDAHSFGKIHRNEKRIGQIKEEVASSTSKPKVLAGEGKVTFDGDKLKLDGRRSESLKHIEAIAKITGVNFHIFESYVDKNGKRVFKDKNGKIKEAPNGIFYESDSSIWIDLNAGNEGEGLMLYTVAHELTHFIRKWSPAKFDALADFLMEQYANDENVSIQELINEQIKKAKDDNREIDFDEAYEEFVADSMEKMLTDGRVLKNLYTKDKGLFNKIKTWIDKMASRISKYYDGVDPDSKEGKFVAGLNDEFKKLQDLFADALSDASTNYKAAGREVSSIGARDLTEFAEAETTDGKQLFQYRAMKADKDIYRDMLKTANIMSDAEINNLFETVDAAMDIIVENLEVLDFAWDVDINDRAFNPVKPNSDSLYQVSVDFSTLCRKRLLQQAIQVHLQEALNKPLTREEGIAIRDALMAIQEEGRQIEIACALCYVESARMKSPAQIKKFLNNRDTVIKDFFASKSDAVKAEMKKAEMDARKKLGVGDKSLKSLPGKTAKAIRDAKKAVKANYTPTSKEQAVIDAARKMSVTDFTSPEGLENLAKNHKDLFDAYTSYIRNATKSKGIEADTWWRAGDSAGIGDTLIANMNAENGLRSQSWSDFQVIHLLDYIGATIELSTRKAKMQAYSKVADYVELMGNTGQMINISLIPSREFSGKLDYDSTEGMDYKRALELRDKYHATAGTICIGINNTQIQMLLADGNIDYVIPYHRSGMAKTIRKAMHIPTWDEYENYQSESELDRQAAIKQAKKYGVKLLDENDPNYHKHSTFSEWFDVEVAKQIAKMENVTPSNKAMQKKYGVMYGGYMAMQNAADTYLKLCAERGIAPKFSNEKADFTGEDNYWKLLIDRKMVDNVTGEIIEQQAVKPVFDQSEVLRILNDELERYPGVKADQEYATRKVVEGFLSGNIKGGMSSQAIANAMKTPVDNVTKTNILASSQVDDGKLSGRTKAQLDADYMKAIEDGDMETVQRMVDEAAKRDGYSIKAYHGTNALFNVFKADLLGTKNFMASSAYKGFFAAKSRETAENYTGLNSSDVAALMLNSDAQKAMEQIKAKHNFEKANSEYEMARELFFEEYKNAHGYKEAVTDIVDRFRDAFPNVDNEKFKDIIRSFEYDWNVADSGNGNNNANQMHTEFKETEASNKFEELNKQIFEEWEQAEIKRRGYVPNVKDLYLKIENPLVHDFKKEGRDVDFTDLIDEAKKNRNDGCIFKNVQDGAGFDDIYVVFDNKQLKSSDPITYDDNGNIIPLSKRFDSAEEDIRYSSRYWYPNMSQTEISYVRRIAKHEVNTTDNYIDSKDKWLYNAKNGNVYFALYSTENEDDPTVLYACKGTRATFEHDFLVKYFEKEVDDNGSIHAQSGVVNRILKSVKVSSSKGNVHSGNTVGGRGNAGNATVYSQNKRNRPSDAFLDCLRNIGEVQKRNERDGVKLNPDRYSSRNKAQQDYVEIASKAVMTTDRIDYLIEDSGAGSRVDYANYWITSISPTDFLNMTLPLNKQDRSKFDKFPSEWNENSNMDTYDYMGELKKNMRQTPYLAIDITTGEVVGHEGRHRIRALERDGIKSVEIRVEFRDEDGRTVKYSPDGKRLQVKDAVEIINQFGTGQTASITNVIPLNKDYRDTILDNYGEATSTSDIDVRYSSRNKEAVENYEKVNELLTKENEQLREDVKALKELVRLQNKVTHGKMMKESSLNLITKRLMRYAHAEGNTSELTSYLKDVYGYILEGKDVSWEAIAEKAQPAVDWLRDNEKKTKHREEYADEVLSHLRTLRVTLDDQQKQEVANLYGSYNTYRQKAMGKIFFVNEGISLDSAWQELCELYPNYFKSDVTPNDQPIVLMDIFNDLQNSYVEDYYYEDEMVAQDLLTKIYEGFWDLDTVYTVADKNQREISSLKNKHKEQMDKLRENHAEKDAKLREERKAKIEEVRSTYLDRIRATEEKYREARQKTAESRSKTELRRKIKRVVADLSKLLNNGTKERNTKEDLKDTVSAALDAASFLFTNNVTNEEIVRNGVEFPSTEEKKLLDEYVGYLDRRDEYIAKIDALAEAMVNNPELSKQIDDNYNMIDVIDRKLYALNKKLEGLFEREKAKMNAVKASSVLDTLAEAYKSIETSSQAAVAGVYDEYLYNRLLSLKEEVKGTLAKDMTITQLQSIYDAYKMVLTTVRNANRLFDAQAKATVEESAQATASELYQVGGAKEKVAVIKDFIQRNGWNTLKPIYAFRMLGSKTLERLYNNIRKGEDTWYVDVADAKAFRQEINKKYGFSSWDFDKMYEFKAKSGKNFKLSLEQIMSIYAYSRREQALAHMIEGGIVFDSDIKVTEKVKGVPVKYKVNTADAHNISESTIAEIVGKLTDEQRGYVEEMQAYLSNTMGEKGNEVSLAMYGVRLYKEKNYFPLKSSQYYMNFKPDDAGEFKIKNSGFSQGTVQHANNPVVLSDFTSVWGNHVNDMSMYHAFVLPLEDFNRVFNYKTPSGETRETKSVKATLQNAFGSGAETYIRTLLRDLNGGVRSQTGVELINKLTALAKKGATFLSSSVTIQQPTAIARALAYIPAKYLVPATSSAYNLKNHNKDWEEVKTYAPIAGIKEMGYFDTGMGQSSVDWITSDEYEGFREKFSAFFTDKDFRDEVLSKAPSMADEIGWVQIWHAVKREIADTTDLKVGSEEFMKRCGERFTEVVTLTQVYDSVFSRSGLMRSKDTGVKMVTAFMAEPTTIMNMAVDAIVQGKRIGGKAGLKLASGIFAAIAVSNILNAVLKALVTAGRDDDEDETWFEKYLSDAVGGVANSFLPFEYIPLVKDFWSVTKGYDVSRMDMSIVSDLRNAVENLYSDKKSTYTKVSGVITSVAAIFGIPVKNLERDIRGAINTFKTMTNGVQGSSYGIVEAVKEGITGEETSKMQRAENASIKGDKDTVKQIVSDLIKAKVKSGKTEKEAKSAVRSSFTSRYKQQYVDAYKRKDINAMNRIRKLLYATGIYGTLTELDKTLQSWRTEE